MQSDTKLIKYIDITLTRIEKRVLDIKKFDFRNDYMGIEKYIELFESLILNAYSLESHSRSLLEKYKGIENMIKDNLEIEEA